MAELWQQNETILASLEGGTTVDPLPSPLATVPGLARALSAERAALSDFVAEYTPSVEIAKLSMPSVILQGTTDIESVSPRPRH